jgi:hypothetical protein
MPYLIVNTAGFSQAVSKIYLAFWGITFVCLPYKHGVVLKLVVKKISAKIRYEIKKTPPNH